MQPEPLGQESNVSTGQAFGCIPHPDRVGVLLAQLGTPEAPTASALRRYLRQFLWDPRVVEISRFWWWLILNCVILVFRPGKSAALYRRIWSTEGSPLLVHTRRQAAALQGALAKVAAHVQVAYGMRYGQPALEKSLDQLIQDGCRRILLLPLYPHYSAATTAATYDAVMKHLLKRRWVPTLRVAEPYFRHPAYLAAVAADINAALERLPSEQRPERLLLSYHGIPLAYARSGDPYCCMCTETTAALKPLLGLPAEAIMHTYQSRFGRQPWLTPYTDETLRQLAQQGVRRVMIACPGFSADCLETLDELGHEGRRIFLAAGGSSFTLVPCLNDHPGWIEALSGITLAELGSWLQDARNKAPGSRVTCLAGVMDG